MLKEAIVVLIEGEHPKLCRDASVDLSEMILDRAAGSSASNGWDLTAAIVIEIATALAALRDARAAQE